MIKSNFNLKHVLVTSFTVRLICSSEFVKNFVWSLVKSNLIYFYNADFQLNLNYLAFTQNNVSEHDYDRSYSRLRKWLYNQKLRLTTMRYYIAKKFVNLQIPQTVDKQRFHLMCQALNNKIHNFIQIVLILGLNLNKLNYFDSSKFHRSKKVPYCNCESVKTKFAKINGVL